MKKECHLMTRKELRALKRGQWVAWPETAWADPTTSKTTICEAPICEYPVKSAQFVVVKFQGGKREVYKNQLYTIPPVVEMEEMDTVTGYDN